MKPWYLRAFLWLLTHTFYRLRIVRPDRLPSQGGALLVSNHVSYIDLLLLLAGSRRFIRFLLPAGLYERRWLRPFLRLLRVIPLPLERRAGEFTEALRQAQALLQHGEVVGVFAEKQISRIGVMLPFRWEFKELLADVKVPIVPVGLDGVWGSIFSYHGRRFFWKLPQRIPYPVTIHFGQPMPTTATTFEVRSAIQELITDAWCYRRQMMAALHRAFMRQARNHPFTFAMADARVPKLSFGGALMKTLFLAGRLRSHWAEQSMVGILLPPSVAGALINFAALLAGKVSVNLNYTMSEDGLASCVRQCQLQILITSKTFLDRIKLKPPCPTLLIEDVVAQPRWGEKLRVLALSWLAPIRVIERAAGRAKPALLDDVATVIFSSGSTGEPKGVMLTHYNITSNVEQLNQTFNFGPQDRFLGILPFFHSFGFTATLVVPGILGLGVAYHPNPFEGKPIGDLVRRYGVTYLMATPAFLQVYLRSCEPDDFGSLRLVMVGAEKLPDWLASAFEEKFGLRPIEGYGCTECSPVVAANTHEFRAPGMKQSGSRRGKIGHPLPGISVRIVHPETHEPVPLNQPGLLLVRGPNVMKGYLGRPDKTADVLVDLSSFQPHATTACSHSAEIDTVNPKAASERWYVTGDIAALDQDGFMQITDRLSRFSKIGGEMVPHIKVEEKLHALAGVRETTFAVTGIPDAKKGECLVVLHTLPEQELQKVLDRLPQLDLPNLWLPRPHHFYYVSVLPQLASGKQDLRRIRQMALELNQKASSFL